MNGKRTMKWAAILVVNLVLVLLLFPGALRAQEKSETILERHVTIDTTFNANIWSALHNLAYQGIPIGFEAGEHWNVDMGPRLKLKSGALLDVLNSIAEQDISYTWRDFDGVINFYPAVNRETKSVLFLDMRVGPLTVNKGENRASVVEKLSKLSLNNKTEDPLFSSAIGAGNHLGLPDKFEKQIDIPATDMRNILNMLIKLQKYSPIWSVTHYRNQTILSVVF